ncbi:S-adenosylmethionine:tRNA ribosyltransferase-isomerase [Fulvitalea axinellae]|uniref:S-adenosylmethionine:tRNA ribosyltransferase-isomerase n=1 Tax=Fulvitalea axinellae TaxID=1182444 RepID=A0AAU9D8D6_9BACT|nr:S-adenosylmethionine:tRNA ribosyltransferase-isomerase [Fulvitalea axinellae]
MDIPKISLDDYLYDLPDERIAKHPLSERDASKLLHYSKGQITHNTFSALPGLIPANATLFFNDTKVIPARLFFSKDTGAKIEIFLLQPEKPSTVIAESMLASGSCAWSCMVGNFKKWKDDQILTRILTIGDQEIKLTAKIEDRKNTLIRFDWDNTSVKFVEIVEAAGTVPLPPYMNRQATEEDKPRYQTVYSKNEGAVAAPTSGLHFTEDVLEAIKDKGVITDHLTLHVSAGTFRPIKEENVLDHPMHSEQVIVSKQNVKNLANPDRRIFCVGTTSMRTIESLYWYGVKLISDPNAEFRIEKLYPYQFEKEDLPSRTESMTAVLDKMERDGVEKIHGSTEIFIFPGYSFPMIEGMVTNFHQPGSTLILLVAAFIGEDWRKIYKEAMDNGYRFLSYGDSSFLER